MMTRKEKIINTIVFCLSIVVIPILWATRAEWLPSLSAFANQHNAIFYWIMHLSAAGGYFYYWSKVLSSKLEFLIGIGLLLILGFDMYNTPMLHNIFTVATFLLAMYNDVVLSSDKERPLAWFRCFVASSLFALGFFVWDVHFFFTEAVAMFCILVGMLRRIWVKNTLRINL